MSVGWKGSGNAEKLWLPSRWKVTAATALQLCASATNVPRKIGRKQSEINRFPASAGEFDQEVVNNFPVATTQKAPILETQGRCIKDTATDDGIVGVSRYAEALHL